MDGLKTTITTPIIQAFDAATTAVNTLIAALERLKAMGPKPPTGTGAGGGASEEPAHACSAASRPTHGQRLLVSYYYTHFGDTQPNRPDQCQPGSHLRPEDEIQTVQAALALFQAIGGNVVDGWGADARRATRRKSHARAFWLPIPGRLHAAYTTRCAHWSGSDPGYGDGVTARCTAWVLTIGQSPGVSAFQKGQSGGRATPITRQYRSNFNHFAVLV